MFLAVLLLCSCAHRAVQTAQVASPDVTAAAPVPEVLPAEPAAETRTPAPDPEEEIRTYLVSLLMEKGLDPGHARGLIEDPRLVFDPGFILKNLSIAPPKASPKTPGIMAYDPVYITRGREFMKTHRGQLDAIAARYGTPAEIVTAILIVETRLGTYPMRYRAMRVFCNMAMVQDPVFIVALEEHYKSLTDLLRDEEVLKVATAKAKWASGELYELIVLAGELGLDPHEIMGSVSGALGPAQFIPSSFRKYGVDGNDDGRTDPFDMADAMASIGHYLQKAGWRADGDEQKQRTAIYQYNRSDIYVNTVLKIYRELAGA